jgi:hypothetical protein
MATRWSPDTCSCVLEYDSDIAWTATIAACPKHKAVSGSSDHLAAVFAHNRAKNAVVSQIATMTGADPGTISAHYDPAAPAGNDPVIVSAPLTVKQASALQAALSNINIATPAVVADIAAVS